MPSGLPFLHLTTRSTPHPSIPTSLETSDPIALSLSSTILTAVALGPGRLSLTPKHERTASALARSPELTASAYIMNLLNTSGPPKVPSERMSSGSNDLTMTILSFARVMATFRRFSPPRELSHPNLCMNFPSRFFP